MEPETVECKWCGIPTTMLGTKCCDGCWELETRIRMDVLLAGRILKRHKEILTRRIIDVDKALADNYHGEGI